MNLPAFQDPGRDLQILEAAVRAGPDESLVERLAFERPRTGLTLSTVCGQAICGSRAERS